jgi:hypothetical protein
MNTNRTRRSSALHDVDNGQHFMVVGQDGNGPWTPASGALTQARAASLIGHLTVQGKRDRYKTIDLNNG